MPHGSILCIDDQPDELALRKTLLQSKGNKVLTATDGPSGIALANTREIDAVVLDYTMPDMDGAEVAHVLKHEHPELPIVLLTGVVCVAEELRQAVDEYVEKDEGVTVLLNAIEYVLSRSRSGRLQ
jgi:two-component system OmpR family response regulator